MLIVEKQKKAEIIWLLQAKSFITYTWFSFERIKGINIFLKSRNYRGHFWEPLCNLCHGKSFECQQHLCAVILLVVPLKPNAQCWFKKECGNCVEWQGKCQCHLVSISLILEIPQSISIAFGDLGYLLRGKHMVEKSALPTLQLWWTEMDVTTTCYSDSRGTDTSIDPVRTNHTCHTACMRCTLHLCTALCTFTNGSLQNKSCFVLLELVINRTVTY